MSQENEIEEIKLTKTTDFLPSDEASCSPSLAAALLGVQRIMGQHEDDRFAEERHMVALAEELEKVKQARDEARKAAERWRDSMRSGMVMQSNPPSLIFDWENS